MGFWAFGQNQNYSLPQDRLLLDSKEKEEGAREICFSQQRKRGDRERNCVNYGSCDSVL